MKTEATLDVWRKSSFCDNSSGNCPEVIFRSDKTVGMRDSRSPGITLSFTVAEWVDFTTGVQAGEFDA